MAAPASAPPPVLPSDPLRDLAAKIYVELVCRNVVVTENAAQIKSNPENLAKISFKLADAFQRIHIEIGRPAAQKNQDFSVNSADLASWNAAKP
ncbi:MAG TPA: hypothetical protein VFB20_13355 [Burkholderiales bacterium]|nr:hypothetical protein [Burkholderiales bacterium]